MTTTFTLDARATQAVPVFPAASRDAERVLLGQRGDHAETYSVIVAVSNFWAHHNANVHLGGHGAGARASEMYEAARARVAQFLNAREAAEIVFTRGTTEAINLVASSWGEACVRQGDEIIVTEMEHHANLLPWMRPAERQGAHLKV